MVQELAGSNILIIGIQVWGPTGLCWAKSLDIRNWRSSIQDLFILVFTLMIIIIFFHFFEFKKKSKKIEAFVFCHLFLVFFVVLILFVFFFILLPFFLIFFLSLVSL